jgi:hypothetical protein
MKIYLVSVILFFALHAHGQTPTEGWSLFRSVKFKTEYFKEHDLYLQVPLLDEKIKSKIGTLVTLSGHYLPLDMPDKRIILSVYPYASCFFCGGGGGPESVSEIVFAQKPPKFSADQWITVQGKLKINTQDIDRMNFILEDAVLIPQKK